jgi:hypothetical protein
MTRKQKIQAISTYAQDMIGNKKLMADFSDIGVRGTEWVWDYKALNQLHDHELDVVLVKLTREFKKWAFDAIWHGKEI